MYDEAPHPARARPRPASAGTLPPAAGRPPSRNDCFNPRIFRPVLSRITDRPPTAILVSFCSREAGRECKCLADLAERRRRHFAQLALESSYNQRRDALHICHAHFPQKGKPATLLRICFAGSGSSRAHKSLMLSALRDHAATRSRPDGFWRRGPDQPATLHRDAGSSSWSSTSCSAARERITSRASLSAASIT